MTAASREEIFSEQSDKKTKMRKYRKIQKKKPGTFFVSLIPLLASGIEGETFLCISMSHGKKLQ